jgi:hypothetical protein
VTAGSSTAEAAARQVRIEAILTLEERERRASRTRLEAWTQHFLPGLFYAFPGDFHRALYRDAEDLIWRREVGGEVRSAAAIACPRGHGKSTAMVLGLPLWTALEWRNMPAFHRTDGTPAAPYIVIVSDTLDQARARLLDIRDELENNERLIGRYGNQAPGKGKDKRRKWTETHLELANGVIIRAMGFGSKVRGLVRKGRRPSLILCDDMENDQAVDTEGQRSKLRRWFTKALIPTGKAGELLTVVVGTILHADSLLARLLSPEDFPGWIKRRYAAQVNDQGLPDPEGTVILWPEYWTAANLAQRRREIGSLAFAQEYLNQPIDGETAIFRWEWLEAARQRGAGLGFLYASPPRISFAAALATWDPVELADLAPSGAYQVLVTAWDLAVLEDEKQARDRNSDFTVGITVGLDPSDRFHVRRIYRKRGMTPAELRGRVIAEQSIVGADYVVIERNAAQRFIELDLRGVPGLPVVGHTTTRAKSSLWDGVPGLALLWELGRIDLAHSRPAERERVDTLVQELHGLGLEAHDDTVMALWMAVTSIRRWMRIRNDRRRKLIGPPPPGYYVDPFPSRDTGRQAA